MLDKIKDGKLQVQQGIIACCAGGNYTNVVEAANMLRGKSCCAGEFSLDVYPSSQPVFIDLARKGYIADLMGASAIIKTAFCGPCFGAGDTPMHNGFSIRHTTRNFPNREGSKPGDGSAREQAASCQRVIGGLANITKEYATKRYRSNVMNWGMIPFHLKGEPVDFEVGDYIYVPGIREALDGDLKDIKGYVIKDGKAAGAASAKQIDLYIMDMTKNEREIVKAGCLINFNKNRNAK